MSASIECVIPNTVSQPPQGVKALLCLPHYRGGVSGQEEERSSVMLNVAHCLLAAL